ncbi:MAG: BrnT family toxin [Burkholderiales bacterium]
MDFEFDWDTDKASASLAKHRVSFAEAASVFYDSLAITYPDGEHSTGESRFLTFGLSDQQRRLVVSHTEISRGIRLISARRVTREERKMYEEGS